MSQRIRETVWRRAKSSARLRGVRARLVLAAVALTFALALMLAGCQAASGAWEGLSAPTTGTDTIPIAMAVDPFVPQLFYAGTSDGQVARMRIESLGAVPSTGIPTNAAVSAVLPDPAHKGVVLAGTSDGVYRSSDIGDTWHALGSGLPHSDGVDALALGAAGSGGTAALYAGTEQHGVYISRDGGTSWQPVGAGLPSGVSVYGLTYDAAATMLYAALVGHGVYASSDGGQSWSARSAGLPDGVDAFVVLALPHTTSANGDTLIVGTSKGAFASADGGQMWHAAGLGQTRVIALATDPTAASALYAGTSNADNSSGSVFRTTDGGAHWTEVAPGLAHAVAAVVVLKGTDGKPVVFAAAGRVYRYPTLGGQSTAVGDVLAIIFFVALIGFAYIFLRRSRRQLQGLPGFGPPPSARPGQSARASEPGASRGAGPRAPRVTATGAIIPTREEIARGRVEDGSSNGQTRGSSSRWVDQPGERDDSI